MATLEKIRSKSVLLFIIIIVALLAFILGDFLTSGRTYFGTGTTVAQAGSAKVDYTDYQNRVNALAEQQQNSTRQTNADVMAQQAITDLLAEQLLRKEYEKLGLVVTDSELSAALTGANIHPAAVQYIAQLSQSIGIPTPNGASVFDAISNPTKYGLPAEAGPQLKQYWISVEQQVEQAILSEKFAELMMGLFTANQLDAKNLFNDVATTRHISYAMVNLNTVKDEDVQVTDEDRMAAWNENKADFRIQEPMRSIDYIMVRIEPSAQDRMEGQQAVEDALVALKNSNGTDGISADGRFVVNRYSATYAQINDKGVKAFLDSATVGSAVVSKHVGDNYNLVKLIERTTGIDSVNVSFLGRTDKGNLDSIYARVNAGTAIAEVLKEDGVQGQDSIWASLVAPGIPENIKDALTNRAVGETFILTDTVQGAPVQSLYRINSRHNPVAVYDIALIDFTVDPSNETITKLSTDLNTYVSSHSSADAFAEGAAEQGYTILKGMVSNSTPMIGGDCNDCRPVIKWIMDAKQGQVMPVYQDNKQTYLLTVAVTGIFEDDYLPWNCPMIADHINSLALNNAKARKLIDQYSGKASDINGYAKAMGVEVQSGDAIFNAPMLATIGFGESLLQGQVAAAPLKQVVGPVKGKNAVVVFVVNSEDNKGRDYTFEEYSNQFNRNLNLGNMRNLGNSNYIVNLLRGDNKVENYSLNFVAAFGE